MEKTREELLKEMRENMKKQPHPEHLTEVSMPGVVMPVHYEDK